MNAKELMIGDWVFALKTIGGSSCIARILELGQKPYLACGIWGESHNYELLEPIPLTSYILEMNGFSHDDTDVWRNQYGEIIVEIGIYHPDFINIRYKSETPDGTNEGEISNICKVDGGNIMAHELQHALRLFGLNDVADNFKV